VFKKTTSGTNQTQVVYVSNQNAPAASDNYCGFKDIFVAGSLVCPGPGGHSAPSGHGPKKTISVGMALLRNGYPDWLLLKKGDTWTLNAALGLGANGVNAAEKQLISSYGTGSRPKIIFPSGSNGINTSGRSHVAVVDLYLVSSTPYVYTSGEGISNYNSTGILVEGCRIDGFTNSIIDYYSTGSLIRRNVSYLANGAAILSGAPSGCLFEENVIYKCGLLFTTGGHPSAHGFYITCASGSTSYTLRANIVGDVGSANIANGFDLRPDNGVCDNNLVVACAAGMDIAEGPCWTNFPDMTISVTNNVVLDGRNPFTGGGSPYGMRISQGVGSSITDNIVANAGAPGSQGIRMHIVDGAQHCNNLTIARNVVYGWSGDMIEINRQAGTVSNMAIYSNELQGSGAQVAMRFNDSSPLPYTLTSYENRCYSTSATPFVFSGSAKTLAQYLAAVGDPPAGKSASSIQQITYPNPTQATIPDYMAHLGQTPTHDAFMAKALNLSKGNWQLAYTAPYVNTWIRAKFGK
jgi:hypothetical protein